ncbi:MAG TPA: hypothetical protein VHE32_01520 [Rhodanobacteraceae bacterium]|nr:hypothetical protein [Rhodanobacteraceae bacterium]
MISQVLLLAALSAPDAAAVIPARFEADRIFATPQTKGGEPLKIFVDTGGGSNLLCRSAAERAGLAIAPLKLEGEDAAELGENAGKTTPTFRDDSIPANADGDASFLVIDCSRGPMGSGMRDGLLSSRWFSGRAWTFDYAAHTLALESKGGHAPKAAHATPMGLRAKSAEGPAFSMPRLTVRVDGHDLDVLLDTGATGHPTPAGEAAQGAAAVDGYRATSFITKSTFDAWHAAHPDWTVVEKGDDIFAPKFVARLIRVPSVEIAGWRVGPVWFTDRPDGAFRTMMSSMTDKPVEGAIGGNALKHFRMTLDYPRGTAYFACVDDCASITPRRAP